MIQFRDGPYVRPHPAFWRVALGLNLLYELALVFILFQDLPNARLMMKALDPSLGVPLAEKSYAEDCSFTPKTLWVRLSIFSPWIIIDAIMIVQNAIDIFCLAHALGWVRRFSQFTLMILIYSLVVWKGFDSSRLLVLLGMSLTRMPLRCSSNTATRRFLVLRSS